MRLLLGIAIALLALPASAHALTVHITGAGAVTGTGIDCSRDAFGNPGSTSCTGADGTRLTATPAAGWALDHWIGCAAADPCDPSGSDVTAAFRDASPPTVAITSPTAGPVRSLVLTATASDNFGVKSVDYTINGVSAGGSETAPYRVSPKQLPADGPATVSAVATDYYGNTSTPATVDVIVDTTPPALGVDGPNGQTSGAAAVEAWTLAASDANGIASVRCAVAPKGQTPAFGACSGGSTRHSVQGLAGGAWTFSARATDGAGNATVVTRDFTVDATPPETTITYGPLDGALVGGSAVTYSFASSEGGSTFACRLSAAGWPGTFTPCSGSFTASGLAPGTYAFDVVATDAAGNADPSPARRSFTLTGTPGGPAPEPTPTPEPSPAPHRTRAPMRLATRFRVRGDRTRVTRLLATRLAAGSAIRVSCRGRGCSFAARTIHAQDDRADLARPFGPRALRPGARIRLRVTAPGHTSRTVTITVRRGRAPLIVR